MKNLVKRIPVLNTAARASRDVVRSIWGPYRLKRRLQEADTIRIVVGAAGYNDPGWIPTDVQFFNVLRKDHWERFFQSGSVDAILAEHVWEHLTLEDGRQAAGFCFEFLRSGGHFRIAVPDGFNPDEAYIDYVKVGGSGPGADDHKVLYTHESLQALLQDCGFKTRLLEYWDQEGGFHATEWDVSAGMIHRSLRHDKRNQDGTVRYTSLIIDALKP